MPEKLAIPDREEIVRKYERDYQIRNPDALVGPNTAPGVDARGLADQLLPLYAEASNLGDAAVLENLSGTDVEDAAADLLLPRRLPAVGASGAVQITTSVGGATVQKGQELKDIQTGKRFKTLVGGLYQSGAQIAVGGKDTGPETNLEPGTLLRWTSPSPGMSPTCTVVEQPDGTGLTGGREKESDREVQNRIRQALSNPAVAGNEAAYRAAALKTPTVSLQAPFTYAASNGPGTISMVFTLRPLVPGGSRIPNDAQVAAVRAQIVGQMPENDTLIMAQLVAQMVRLVLLVRWQQGVSTWRDGIPWPVFDHTVKYFVMASPAPTALGFTVTATPSSSGTLLSPPGPQVGQTIGVFDKGQMLFVPKRILTVTGTNPWALTFDTGNGASDTNYAPEYGQYVCPWSDALNALLAPVLDRFDNLGPGEQVATFYDAGGRRQKRSPAGFAAYPSTLTGRMLTPLYDLAQVDDVQVVEPSLPFAPNVGAPGTLSRILQLEELAAYPL